VWHAYPHQVRQLLSGSLQFLTPVLAFPLIGLTLNHAAVFLTYGRGLGKRKFPMTKHRTITGFVAVALLGVAATAATLRPLPSKNHPNASAGIMSLSELATDVNKLATDNYDDQSFVYSAKRN
jgi:hypothetical protein